MGTFIEDTIKDNNSIHYEYENAIIQGQIIDAKDIIKYAIKHNKKNVMWYYVYDSFDSFTNRSDDILPNSNIVSFDNYMLYKWTAGEFNIHGGVCTYLLNRVVNNGGEEPKTPTSFDYSYVERAVKQELHNLGCKNVEVVIGPKTVTTTAKKLVGKSFLTGKNKYEDYNKEITVIKWIISVSW